MRPGLDFAVCTCLKYEESQGHVTWDVICYICQCLSCNIQTIDSLCQLSNTFPWVPRLSGQWSGVTGSPVTKDLPCSILAGRPLPILVLLNSANTFWKDWGLHLTWMEHMWTTKLGHWNLIDSYENSSILCNLKMLSRNKYDTVNKW